MTRLSIVIPARDCGTFLARAVASVLDSGLPDVECLVIAADKNEETLFLLPQTDERLVVRTQIAAGPAHAINTGLSLATGDICGVLSGDDCYLPGALCAVRDHFENRPASQILYGNATYIDSGDHPVRNVRVFHPSLRRLRDKTCLCSSAVFFRRDLVTRFGGMDESLQYWMAYEWWVRLAQKQVAFSAIHRPLAGKRIHPGNRISGAPNGVHELPAADEILAVLESKFGSKGTRWPLHYGRLLAQASGMTRDTTLEYDRQTIAAAMHVTGRPQESLGGRWLRAARLIFRHTRTEFGHALKRPRTLVRFLPDAACAWIRRHLTRRLFRLRVDDPHVGKLPASYFRTQPPVDAPTISIVTPNLNQGEFIERTIRSVLDQHYPHLELVVQDGASRDQSVEVIRRYELQLSSWESARDTGQSQAINRGFLRTSGEIMAYLNSDDVLLPGSLNWVARYFQKHPDVDVVYGNRVLIDEDDRVINRWVLPAHDDQTIVWADYIPQETMFWRRRAWHAVGGGLDESFQFAMDWDLILRFRAAGMVFARIPKFLGAFRITDGQKTNQLLNTAGLRDMARLRQRELGRVPCEREVTRHVRGYVRRQWYRERCHDLAEAMVGLWDPPKEWAHAMSSATRLPPRGVGTSRPATEPATTRLSLYTEPCTEKRELHERSA